MKKLVKHAIFLVLMVSVVVLALERRDRYEVAKEFVFKNDYSIQYDQKKGPAGVRNVVLRADRKFHTIFGEYVDHGPLGEGFDFYESAWSDALGVIVVSVYLEEGDVMEFLPDICRHQNTIRITSSEEDQKLIPTVSYRPLWWKLKKVLGYIKDQSPPPDKKEEAKKNSDLQHTLGGKGGHTRRTPRPHSAIA